MSRPSAHSKIPFAMMPAPKNMLEFFEPLRGTDMHLAENRSFRDRRLDEVSEAFAEWDDEPPQS